MDCSLPGSSIHGIRQARILERVFIPFSRESFQPRDQTLVSHVAGRFFTVWATIEKARDFQKNIYFCLISMQKHLCGSQQTGKFLKRWEYQTTLSIFWETGPGCRSRSNRMGHGTMELVQIWKRSIPRCMFSPCLLNLAEDTMWTAGLDKSQVGFKFASRNINNLRYVNGTPMAESREELKSFLMRGKKESEKQLA